MNRAILGLTDKPGVGPKDLTKENANGLLPANPRHSETIRPRPLTWPYEYHFHDGKGKDAY